MIIAGSLIYCYNPYAQTRGMAVFCPHKAGWGHLYAGSVPPFKPPFSAGPPDVQISWTFVGASLQRRATWEWLSRLGAGGPLACQSRQCRALCGGSRIESPAQWKCQREPEISLCDWWAFYSGLLKRYLSHLEEAGGAARTVVHVWVRACYLWACVGVYVCTRVHACMCICPHALCVYVCMLDCLSKCVFVWE